MRASLRSLRLQRTLLSILLTLACPFAKAAAPKCTDAVSTAVFGPQLTATAQPINNTKLEDIDESLLTNRFARLGKPLSTPKFASPARIILSRFAGHDNFHSVSTQRWVSDGKTFVAQEARATYQVGYSNHESILATQQEFSLGKMVETEYLTSSQAKMFQKLGTHLEPGQVNYLEVMHDATESEIKKFYPAFPETRVAGTYANDYKSTSSSPIKTATLWTVAGQVWNEKSKTRNVQLAWEKEDARKSQQLDRTKYKYVWEWGRAAQDVPGDVAPLYAAATLLNYLELRAHGGKLDDAYVMFHSFDKVNTRLYLKMHPGSTYPPDWKDASDSLFLVPLKEALQKYRPSGVSAHIAKLIELSGGKINDLQALDLLIDSRLARWNELDFKTPRHSQETPIILNDLSIARGISLMLDLKRFNMDAATQDRVFDYVVGINPYLHTSNFKGKYDNAADSVATSYQYLHNFNGIEISNLDPKRAAADPQYVASVLMSSFSYYLDQVANTISKAHNLPLPEAFNHAAKGLLSNKITFGVTTSFPEIEKQLRALRPDQESTQPKVITQGRIDPEDPAVKNKPFHHRDAKIFVFTIEHLRQLITNNPDFYRQLGSGLQPGVWRTQYLLSQVDLY